MTTTRPIELHDLKDERKLFDYLREREQHTANLQRQIVQLQNESTHVKLSRDNYNRISEAMQVGGIAPVRIDGLPGTLADPQNPNIPILTALPDANTTPYTTVAVTSSNSRSFYVLNLLVNPKQWVKLGEVALTTPVATAIGGTGADLSLSGGASMVVQQLAVGAPLVVGQLALSNLSDFTDTTTQPFAAGDFTATGGMTWTVIAGNLATFDYLRVKHGLLVNFVITGTTVVAPLGNALQIKVPAGLTASKRSVSQSLLYQDAAGATTGGYINVAAGTQLIQLFKLAEVNWAAAVGTTSVYGQVLIETTT